MLLWPLLICALALPDEIGSATVANQRGNIEQSTAAAAKGYAADNLPPLVLKRVDGGVADRDALSVSFHDPRVSLGMPSGFRDIFSPEDRHDLYMRGDGAIYATFRRSVYVRNKEGKTVIPVPAGTTFSIGMPRLLPVRMESAVEGPTGRLRRPAEAIDVELLSIPTGTMLTARVDGRLECRIWDDRRTGPRSTRTRSPLEVDDLVSDALAQTGSDADAESDSDFNPPRPLTSPLPRFVSDESYRRTRLLSLLEAIPAPPTGR